jgi:hypothetical protein
MGPGSVLVSRPGDTFDMSSHSTGPTVALQANLSQTSCSGLMYVICRTGH